MTTVWAAKPSRRERVLCAVGHATGSEEVCTAVSSILWSLAGYLNNAKGVDIHDMRMEDGRVTLKWSGGERDLAALQMACIGLMQIEKAHGDYIRTRIGGAIF